MANYSPIKYYKCPSGQPAPIVTMKAGRYGWFDENMRFQTADELPVGIQLKLVPESFIATAQKTAFYRAWARENN